MNNMHKIAVAAVAGATVSSLTSLHVRMIDRLFPRPRRRKRIAELREWYDDELLNIKLYARFKSIQFCQENKDLFFAAIKNAELSESEATNAFDEFCRCVHELMLVKLEAQVTRQYNIRLNAVDPDLGYEQKQRAAEMMESEREITERMNKVEYPIRTLNDWMRAHPLH